MNIRQCSIQDCEGLTGKSGTARGWCHKHYRAFQRYGDPLGGTKDFQGLPVPALAYAAGFVDADGCILMERSVDRRVSHRIRHVPRVNAVNADKRPIEYLHSLFGGTMYIHKRKTYDARFPNVKPQHVWAVTGKTAVACARAIAPYLKRKKAQAQLLVQLRDDALWKNGGIRSAVSQEEFERREYLVQRMRRLNGSVNGEEEAPKPEDDGEAPEEII